MTMRPGDPIPRRKETRADQAAVRARALDLLRRLVWQQIGDRPARVWLFGSMARGDWDKVSDIDIAVDIDDPDHRRVRNRIADAAEDSRIPYTVDVVDLRTAGQSLIAEIEEEGIPWPRPPAA